MPPDEHTRRLAELNQTDINEGKRVVYEIKATLEGLAASVTRNAQDVQKLDDRARRIAETVGTNSSRDTDQDRLMQDLEVRQSRTEGQVTDLGKAVSEAASAARNMTGAFEDIKTQIDRLRESDVDAPDVHGWESWKTQWRQAATPTNFVLLIVIVTTIGGLLRGEISRADAAAQIQAAAQAAAIAAPPTEAASATSEEQDEP